MDDAVRDFVEAIDALHRPLFDRVHALVTEVAPQADVVLSYGMPTYRIGKRRLHVGVWQHGVSLYGWRGDGDGGFTAAHPDLVHGKGTIRIRTQDGGAVPDDDLRALAAAVLLG